MKTDIVFENLVIGQSIWSSNWGYVQVTAINEGDKYPISIYGGGVYQDYTKDGKYREDDLFPTLFLTNPFEKNQERVIEVRNHSGDWTKRVLFAFKNGMALCWANAQTIEAAKRECNISTYALWRELQPEQPTAQPKEITLDGVEYVLTPKVK